MRSSKKLLVAEKWVVNASPVIALTRVGKVDLLTRLPSRVVVPRPVAEELLRAPEGDSARRAIESGVFKIVRAPAVPSTILAWDLGRGETSVLAYALVNRGWVAVLDDRAARRCARSLSLPFTGTLSVIILARQHGLIESAAQVIHALRSVGFWLEDSVIRDALERTVGETWPDSPT